MVAITTSGDKARREMGMSRVVVMQIGLVLVLVLAGFSQTASFAQTASFERTRLQILDKGKQELIDVDFQVGEDKAVIVDKRNATVLFEIPYTEIKSISYDGARNRRSELGPLLGIGALFSKSTSHWLFIEYAEGDATSEPVLQFHKDEFEQVIAALEARTGQPVTILTKSRINPTEGSKNVKEVVPHSVERIRLALKPAMEMYGCQITKDEDDKMECKRGRNENRAGQGCGGEKVTGKFKAEGSSTRVEIKTGKGFMGMACKKNWSTPMFNEMMKNLASTSTNK